MSSFAEDFTKEVKCEICRNVNAAYRPKFNRILCLQHSKELEVEGIIYTYTARSIENLVGEMLLQNQTVLSKQKILEVMKTASNKVLSEFD